MGTPVQIIAALNGELAHVVKGTDNVTLKTKNQYIINILAALAVHQSAEHTILANESLSQEGKMKELKKLGTAQTAPALKWLSDDIKKLEAKDQRYRTQFFTMTSGIENAVERMLTYTYFWTKLDPLDQSARVTRFVQAAERDEIQVMAAMLENPFSGPMVNEEVKARALTERAKRLTPNDYHNFEQTQILLEVLTMIRDWLGRWLALEVGVEISVIRTNFGDELADALAGSPLEMETQQLTGASK